MAPWRCLPGRRRGQGSEASIACEKAALHYLKTWFALDFAIVSGPKAISKR